MKEFAFLKTVIMIILVFLIIILISVFYYVKKVNTKIIKDSAYQYIDVVETYVLRKMLENDELDGIYNIDKNGALNGNRLSMSSNSLPSGGFVEIKNSKVVSGCLTINNYKVEIENSNINSITKGKCD